MAEWDAIWIAIVFWAYGAVKELIFLEAALEVHGKLQFMVLSATRPIVLSMFDLVDASRVFVGDNMCMMCTEAYGQLCR